MMENVYTFGKDGSLVGVVTEPDSHPQKDSLPGVVLWNAGLLHRVGPFRLYVDMARKLASMGFLVFRFDLAGKGDSETPKDTRLYEQRAVADIREAMDSLSVKRGADEFVLIGLCSGADEAHSVAVADSRVSGAVLLDACGYRTLGFYPRYFGGRLFKPKKWKNFLTRTYHRVFQVTPTDEMFGRKFPPKQNVKADLAMLIERGLNLLYIYSSGAYEYYNYPGQFEDMFGPMDFQGRLQVEYFGEADHLYTLLEDRNKLMKTICDWMQAHYGSCKKLLTRSGHNKHVESGSKDQQITSL